MANFIENLRAASPQLRTATTQRPQQTQQKTDSIVPKMNEYIQAYNSTKNWDEKERLVNSMMDRYPNPDQITYSFINRLNRVTMDGKEQSKVLNDTMKRYQATQDINERERLVNNLMDRYPNPSPWLKKQILAMDDITRRTKELYDSISRGDIINNDEDISR